MQYFRAESSIITRNLHLRNWGSERLITGPERAPAGRSLSAQRQRPAWGQTRHPSPRATAGGLPSASTPASCGLRPLSFQAPPHPVSSRGALHLPPRAGLRSHAQGPCRRATAQALGVLSAAPAKNTCAPPHPGSRLRGLGGSWCHPRLARRVPRAGCGLHGPGARLGFGVCGVQSPESHLLRPPLACLPACRSWGGAAEGRGWAVAR